MGEYYDQRMHDFERAQESYYNEDPFNAEEVEEGEERKQPEYLETRCCMCPNIKTPENRVCPSGGPTNKTETPCRFVKSYRTGAGVIVQIKKSRFDNKYCVNFNERESLILDRFNSFDEAQADINCYAKRSEWEEV